MARGRTAHCRNDELREDSGFALSVETSVEKLKVEDEEEDVVPSSCGPLHPDWLDTIVSLCHTFQPVGLVRLAVKARPGIWQLLEISIRPLPALTPWGQKPTQGDRYASI